MNENEIASYFEYLCKKGGSQRLSFGTIVAGGTRSGICNYEYTLNNQMIHENDLIMLDGGGEYHMYSSDITRTFPISGRYSPAQRNLYEAVLETQKLLISQIRPGMSVLDIDKITETSLTNEVLKRGICTNISFDDLYENINEFFTGVWGHAMGMAVHENWKTYILEEGIVMAIEPCLKFDLAKMEILESLNVAEEYWGMGVSVEDDVLLSEDGVVVLSGKIPKECDEIEEFMNK